MQKAQVFLHDEQKQKLRSIAARTGRKQSELIRRGVELVIAEEEEKSDNWREAWQGILGIWADRDDIEESMRAIRKDWGRRYEKLHGSK